MTDVTHFSPEVVHDRRGAAPGRSRPADESVATDIGEVIAILRANVRLIAAAVAFALALAAVYIVLTPTVYTATTSVVVDVRGRAAPTDPDTPLASGLQDTAMVETQMRVITSTDVLARVVDEEKLADDPESNGSGGIRLPFLSQAPTSRDPQEQREAAIEALGKRVLVRHSQNNYVLDIDVSVRDARVAQHLADAVAKAYLADLDAARQSAAKGNLQVVSQRFEALRQRVEEAGRRVADFKTRNGITDANGRDVLEQQLSNAIDDLTRARDRLSDSKARYDQIVRLQRAGLSADAVGDALKSPALERLNGQLADLQRQRANLATTLGERHPAMQEVESQIRDMRKLVAAEIDRIATGAANEYQVARDTESQASQRVEALRKQVEDRTTTMAQLQILQREADTTRAAFERYQRVRDAASEGPSPVVARIIAPASLPLYPSAPKKKIALAAALFGGLFLGTLIALTKDYLKVPEVAPRREEPAAGATEGHAEAAPVEVAPTGQAAAPAASALGDPHADAAVPMLIELPRNRPQLRRRAMALAESEAGSGSVAQSLQRPGQTDPYEAGAPYLDRIEQLWTALRPPGTDPLHAVRILVTSFEAGTGKTMLCLALARIAAAEGCPTLLVEANTDRPILADVLPPGVRTGLVGATTDPRVGFLSRRPGQADLCIVPIIEDEEDAIAHLRARASVAGLAEMPTQAAVTIFDGGTIHDEETRELAGKADRVVVVVGPSQRPWLRDEDPAAELRIPRNRIAGYVGSPVESNG